MNIRYLENDDEVRQIARWLYAEWGASGPDASEAKVVANFAKRLHSTQVPLTFVAVDDTGLVGTASLVESDMTVHKELLPWFSCLYVREDRREEGLGEQLLKPVLEEAKRLSYKAVYLWTVKSESYYAKRGWQTVIRERYRDLDAVIMKFDL